jgi:hypothetical protein
MCAASYTVGPHEYHVTVDPRGRSNNGPSGLPDDDTAADDADADDDDDACHRRARRNG